MLGVADFLSLHCPDTPETVGLVGPESFAHQPGGYPKLAAFQAVFPLPHIGSATRRTGEATEFRTFDNNDGFFAG